MYRQLVLGAAGVLAGISVAFAHATLETRQAPVGASYKAVLRVPHGCDGSATVSLRTRIPEGVIEIFISDFEKATLEDDVELPRAP